MFRCLVTPSFHINCAAIYTAMVQSIEEEMKIKWENVNMLFYGGKQAWAGHKLKKLCRKKNCRETWDKIYTF